jgi:hypothetical protein
MVSSLTGVHFLLTYGCTAECAHCFLWGTPDRASSMAAEKAERFLEEIASLKQITDVCAEGGESFEVSDVLLPFLRRATALGLNASALTNASWVESREQARERIAELMAAGLRHLGVSTDRYHQEHVPVERVDLLLEVCHEVGLVAARMATSPEDVMFRGRAAETLAADMPIRPPESFTSCPHESLGAPGRIHLDCYGFLHLCQGLTLGRASIVDAIAGFDAETHPIVRPLLEGGPCTLGAFAVERGFELAPGYVDACHLCYRAREFLRGDFPDLLAPDEMYGP